LSSGPVTDRQRTALQLYYVEGWSQRRIGRTLSVSQPSVHRLIVRGSRWIVETAAAEGGISLPSMRALFASSPTSSSTHVGRAACRREELLDALELRVEQRAKDLATAEECMSSGSSAPTRCPKNHYDQWELRYLRDHAGEPLPTSAYKASNAARYCTGDRRTCTLGCFGCKREVG